MDPCEKPPHGPFSHIGEVIPSWDVYISRFWLTKQFLGWLNSSCWLNDGLVPLPSDPVRPGDPPLGQPPGLLQLLRALPSELPAQRVAHPGGLTVQRQPGAARRRQRRRAGGGGGRRRQRLPGLNVALLAHVLLQPLVATSPPPLPLPATQVEAESRGGGQDLSEADWV